MINKVTEKENEMLVESLHAQGHKTTGPVFSTAYKNFIEMHCKKCNSILFIDAEGYICGECGRVQE